MEIYGKGTKGNTLIHPLQRTCDKACTGQQSEP